MALHRLSILIYHRVLARPDPLFPGEVDQRQFTRQLRLLKRWFRLMPLGQALRLLERGKLPARAACITFDDGYADNVQQALPILQANGVGATFFIATGFLDGGQMWNDRLIDMVRAAPGPLLDLEEHGLGRFDIATLDGRRHAINTLLSALKHVPPVARLERVARLCAGVRPQPVMLSSEEVRVLHRAGMEIGAHTVNHPILASIAEREARLEILLSKQRLEHIVEAPVTLFAYPNGKPGRDYGGAHVEMVRQMGFQAAVSTRRGAADNLTERFELPRFTPWERDSARFLLRMAHNLLSPPS